MNKKNKNYIIYAVIALIILAFFKVFLVVPSISDFNPMSVSSNNPLVFPITSPDTRTESYNGGLIQITSPYFGILEGASNPGYTTYVCNAFHRQNTITNSYIVSDVVSLYSEINGHKGDSIAQGLECGDNYIETKFTTQKDTTFKINYTLSSNTISKAGGYPTDAVLVVRVNNQEKLFRASHSCEVDNAGCNGGHDFKSEFYSLDVPAGSEIYVLVYGRTSMEGQSVISATFSTTEISDGGNGGGGGGEQPTSNLELIIGIAFLVLIIGIALYFLVFNRRKR